MPASDTGRPSVSIVIGSYDHGRFVARAIDSALQQSYPDVEVVVADDGSTDASPAIIRAYGSRIKTVSKGRGGRASALNAGFARARGELIVFLDGDDVLYPDAVEAIVAAWRPEVAKIQYYLDLIDVHGRAIGARHPNVAFDRGDAGAHVLRHGYYPFTPASGSAYSRGALDQLMPIPEERWKQCADYYLSMLAALTGEIVSLDRSMGQYRVHDRHEGLLDRITPAKLAEQLRWDYNLVEELNRFGRPRGLSFPEQLPMRSPSHLKQRLMLLRDSPATHPWRRDSRAYLALLGMKRAWQWPFYDRRKRVVSSIEFLVISVLPAGAIMRVGTAVNRLKKLGWRAPLRSLGLLEAR
jgi:glycosyltransferase involved in cell wall biosynthesis